ncbi:hypothetical protein BCIN_16g00970 [Botrytis cinerea B05.10]|uniref:DNA2/NAM7 helicase-like C-terminal domain-containing protein n=1 Tax=Botryotinia fuckeliana (strain B05.10) TaxID=332648 RepID=A0A384K6W2_BOTFB|nr:hypothetical protein BCIN_16g00970 [Botrytis cinerea B05.10]ATZ58267.1 hypothetical protein BCIN_16g00970 [Botrytis cinerea B05.10]
MSTTKNGSKCSHHNVVVVADTVKRLLDSGLNTKDLMIISFYNESVMLIKRLLALRKISVAVELASVDSSQGREKLVVIVEISTTANRELPLGFLRKVNRLNAAMTRAREGRIVISHKRVCQDIVFNKMASGIWLQDFARTHIADKQTKFITVGRRLLEHETFFTPDRYEIVSRVKPAPGEKAKCASTIYNTLRR